MKHTAAVMALLLLLAAVPASAQPGTPTVTPTLAAGLYAVVVSTTNVRGGPDTRYPIVGQAAAGSTIVLNGRDAAGRWLYISTTASTGWIPVFAARTTGDVLGLDVLDPEDETGAADDIAPSGRAIGTVNVRAEPAISSALIGQIDDNATVAIVGRDAPTNDWLLIEMETGDDELRGWVAYFTLQVTGRLDGLPTLGADIGGQIIVPADQIARALFNVRVRAEPSTTAEILRIVPFNVEVAPIARSADSTWIYLGYDGAFGWGTAELFEITPAGLAALPVYAFVQDDFPQATAEPTAEATAAVTAQVTIIPTLAPTPAR